MVVGAFSSLRLWTEWCIVLGAEGGRVLREVLVLGNRFLHFSISPYFRTFFAFLGKGQPFYIFSTVSKS